IGAQFLSYADNASTIIFNPVFLDRLRTYSVLRFMDWSKTNGSGVKTWSQRAPLSYANWTGPAGVPIEIMVALCNRVGAHPWFNIPHLTDDTYATNFAQLVKANLDPALGVYVEYSNETWNWGFAQATY